MANVVSTLRTSDTIKPRNGVISFSFVRGQSQISAAAAQNIRYIFKNLIEPFVNVRFVETRGEGDINFQQHTISNLYAFELDHDVYLRRRDDTRVGTNGFQGGFGTHGFMTLIHETLHALGLKHPGNYNGTGGGRGPFLPYALDNTTNTLMSYNGINSTRNTGASTPMPFDIKALQSIYGKRRLNPGNTTYRFSSVYSFSDGQRRWGSASQASKLTLADTSGYDTLDFRGLNYSPLGYVFDARADDGIFTTVSAYNSISYRPRSHGRQNLPIQKTSSYGTRLGLDTQIENIYGSRSQDIIFAGKKTQQISGYGGDDAIVGSDRADILWGDTGNDRIWGGKGHDQIIGGSGGSRESDLLGRDVLVGGEGKDQIWGEGGSDKLYGENHDDILYGGSGSDEIYGGRGNDRIFGTRQGYTSDRDKLYGGQGRDRFVLSEKQNVFYKGSGYAIIKDWQAGTDKIQLGRGSRGYTFDTKRLSGSGALDGAVYHNGDLIGVVEDMGRRGLSQRDFVFV